MTGPAEAADRLVAGARAGSREALGRTQEACRRYLPAIAERPLDPDLRSEGGASDLVRETFLEAQRDLARFQGTSPGELRAWLRQVLNHNLAAFTRRFRDTNKRAVDREVGLLADRLSGGPDEGPAVSTLTPSGVAIEHEQVLALRRALERLPEDYRRVVVLRFNGVSRRGGRSRRSVA